MGKKPLVAGIFSLLRGRIRHIYLEKRFQPFACHRFGHIRDQLLAESTARFANTCFSDFFLYAHI